MRLIDADALPMTVQREDIDNAPTINAVLKQNHGAYECFHCGSYSVIWGNDFDAGDLGYEGEGVVHQCSCANCGAMIEYVVLDRKEPEDE